VGDKIIIIRPKQRLTRHVLVSRSIGNGTFRIPLLFCGLRRSVYLVQRGADRRAEPMYITAGYHFNICGIVCIQFKLRANNMIQELNCAFSPDQSVLNFCSTAAASQTQAPPPTQPPSVVRYTNRPFGHQTGYTKHPTIDRSIGRFL